MMKRVIKIGLSVCAGVCLMVLAGCRKSATELAMEYVDRATTAAANYDTVSALALIDSVHALFPKEVSVRRKADTLEWRMDYARLTNSLPEVARKIAYSDSVIEGLGAKFRFFKNEKYEDVGHFEHRLLRTEGGVARCYLKPSVDEHGVAALASYYVGQKAEHKGFWIETGDVVIGRVEPGAGDVSRFDDEGEYHEIMQAGDEQASELLRAVYEHRDERIKVVLEGGGGYTYYLTAGERAAIADSYVLHMAMRTLYEMNDLELRTQQRIEMLKRKLGL